MDPAHFHNKKSINHLEKLKNQKIAAHMCYLEI